MKTILTFLALICTVCLAERSMAQNAEMDAQMKAWSAYMTPGTEHKKMTTGVGDWKATTQMWMDPSQPAITMDAKVHSEMILGDRYIVAHYYGEMMGMPFEGISTMGFDNATKKYASTWVDNMSTGIMYMDGKWRDDINGIEFKGNGIDPASGKSIPMRQVFIFKDENTQVMQMYEERKGKEVKTMEMTLTKM